MIRNWCSDGGANVHHLREVTKLPLVFSEDAHETIMEHSFWPSNVVHGRFFLNDDARNWLRCLHQTLPMKLDSNL